MDTLEKQVGYFKSEFSSAEDRSDSVQGFERAVRDLRKYHELIGLKLKCVWGDTISEPGPSDAV